MSFRTLGSAHDASLVAASDKMIIDTLTSATTLSLAQMNNTIVLGGTAAYAVALPVTTIANIGQSIRFIVSTTAAVARTITTTGTITGSLACAAITATDGDFPGISAAAAADTIMTVNSTNTSGGLSTGSNFEFICTGANVWMIRGIAICADTPTVAATFT